MSGQLRFSIALATASLSALLGSASAQQPAAATTGTSGDTMVASPSAQSIAPSSSPQAGVDTESASVSQVRIVRLSEIRGEAELDRNTGRGFEAAFANIPIMGGARLRTHGGLAEVEFEDNSTLRLTPDSAVVFERLGRKADGGTVSAIQVLQGTVYVSLGKTRANEFHLSFGKTSLGLNPGTHLRLETAPSELQIAVFDGSVDLSGPAGFTTLPRKRTLSLDPDAATAPTLLSQVDKEPFDSWDKQGMEYQKRYASMATTGGTGLLFGSSDLNYYGSFSNLPGCGSVWRPYFTSAAWDPYGSGVWAWYSGAGYSWVSPYPWGWLPFHSGSWTSCGASGWGWRPGGGWVGLQNGLLGGGGLRSPRMRPHPPRPPMPGRPTLFLANSHPLQASQLTAPDTFTFRKDSAGLGVPRETFGRLGRTSASVERHGFAHAEAETALVGLRPEGAHTQYTPGAAARAEGAGVRTWAVSRPVEIISRPSGGDGGTYPNAAAWAATARPGSNGSGSVSGSRTSGSAATHTSASPGWSRAGSSASSSSASTGNAGRSGGTSAGGWSGGASAGAGRSAASTPAAHK